MTANFLQNAPEIEAVALSKSFGGFKALSNVTMRVKAGSFHALLGENGAGKSTLVKCMMGYHSPDEGDLLIDGRRGEISSPRVAQSFGLGMVYQNFTLVPSLTGIENLLITRNDSALIIDWTKERARVDAVMETMPFRVPLDRPVSDLASGEKQKLEILKQLYLGTRFLILDEPTSVLTPDEADEVLGVVRELTQSGRMTALIISHRFREVMGYTDAVTVLRHGALVGHRKTSETCEAELGQMMVGTSFLEVAHVARPKPAVKTPVLSVRNLRVTTKGQPDRLNIDALDVNAGEILGIAGISGNGQRELFECIAGQQPDHHGTISVSGQPFRPTRKSLRSLGVRFLPEEPLHNSAVAEMSLVDNLSFSSFEWTRKTELRFFPSRRELRRKARRLVTEFGIKARSLDAPVGELSGGNVQRMALARELSQSARLLVVANPCFGLDFVAAHDIRRRLTLARNEGAAILLISEDLDELLEISDELAVLYEGQLVRCDLTEENARDRIGQLMAGSEL
ncbi:ABC transporter ATP-binding protein [Falsihalocynthiibacter arcticus]|uniref:ABC transporter ATP-binding protein n=1 Tax=Falsihalocynthiibacter arcticus TaxID=1579316 RepID=A0A126UWL5_9RHOB|nr:ABC transporter ATP-binding protein [Falsihalocynthiibacter arcticus]AML50440.1 ABC transporter ATP-binding protein [Falsihalocynthiibacter arcticus]